MTISASLAIDDESVLAQDTDDEASNGSPVGLVCGHWGEWEPLKDSMLAADVLCSIWEEDILGWLGSENFVLGRVVLTGCVGRVRLTSGLASS